MRFYDLLRLDEALNFIDQSAVKTFLSGFAERVDSPEAKAWLTSKSLLRSVSDRDDCGTAIDPNSVDGNAPTWVHQALERGDTLYDFSPSPELEQHLSHIVDWLNGIADAEAPEKDDPNFNEKNQFFHQCQKDLKGLSKFNLDTGFEKAETWVEEMNKLNSKVNKSLSTSTIADNENYKVVERFDNGCVAVNLISQKALQDEGNKMSHCVGGQGYWSRVSSGKTQIYSIRTPQGESACTIEVTGGKTIQVKGKGNRAPVPKYIDMAVTVLNKVKAHGSCGDLTAAGVVWSDKKKSYGSFSELADLVVDKPPIQVFKMDRNIQLYSTKIGMIAQRMDGPYSGEAWAFNTDLTPNELKSYSTAIRSFVNKFAALHSEPTGELQKVLDAFNLIFDVKDNQVKPFDRELMTHVMTTKTHGLDVLRRGDQYFAGQGDSLVKITTDRNMRWMRSDLIEMTNSIEGFGDAVSKMARSGHTKPTLNSFGFTLVSNGPSEIPTLSRVYYSSGDIKIGSSNNLAPPPGLYAHRYEDGILAMFESGEPVSFFQSGEFRSAMYNGVPVRANQMDAWADSVRAGEIPGGIRNKLVVALHKAGYDDVDFDDDLDLNYPMNKTTMVGDVGVNVFLNQHGQPFMSFKFKAGDDQVLSTNLIEDMGFLSYGYFTLNQTVNGATVAPKNLAMPSPETSKNLATALANSGVRIDHVETDSKRILKSLGISFSKKGFEVDSSMRSAAVYQNGPVTVERSSQLMGSAGNRIIFKVLSSGDQVALVTCKAMTNGVRIEKIDYQDEMEGPEAVADFINDKGRELKIFPPKADNPAEALLPYGLAIRGGQIEVQGGGIDPILMAWKNGLVKMDDVMPGAYAQRVRKHGGKTNWVIYNNSKALLVDINLNNHHIEKMSTSTNRAFGKNPMRLVRKFMEILDHVTEEEENNDV